MCIPENVLCLREMLFLLRSIISLLALVDHLTSTLFCKPSRKVWRRISLFLKILKLTKVFSYLPIHVD